MKNTGNVQVEHRHKGSFPHKMWMWSSWDGRVLNWQTLFLLLLFSAQVHVGNLTLASTEKKDVLVPCLKAGHVGVVSVEFIAPTLEGGHTLPFRRLSHKGQQFGPRVWCSIIVDPFPSTESQDNSEKSMISSSRGDDLTCQQEVSIGRACSQLVDPPETWKASFSPPPSTSVCLY